MHFSFSIVNKSLSPTVLTSNKHRSEKPKHLIMIVILVTSIVYIHDLNAIKMAQRNSTKYFNMHFQPPEETYRSVSNCQELHDVFCKA